MAKRNRTVSLPAELFTAMEQRRDVSWSGVAAEAFRKHLAKLDRRKTERLLSKLRSYCDVG